MKLSQAIFFLLAFVTSIHAFALPDAFDATDKLSDLWKRRGGGGGRGGGSSGGGSSRGGGSSSSSSGPAPRSYAGGSYYGGGAATPYRSGGRSPAGVAPVFLGVGALAIFPGIWLYGAYAYSYPGYYHYHNNTSNQNESRQMECLCGRYQECGCDAKNETDYLTDVANNQSIARTCFYEPNFPSTFQALANGSLRIQAWRTWTASRSSLSTALYPTAPRPQALARATGRISLR